MKRSGTSRFWKTAGGLAGLVIVLAIIIATNLILRNVSLRKDMTEEKIYTLSSGTRNVLKTIDSPVTLKFFFSRSSPEIASALRNFSVLKTFASRVDDLLREYELAGNGRITIEKYDPVPDSEAEEWAQRYGVSGQPIGPEGPSLYIGLVSEAGGVNAVLPVLDPRMEDQLEYNITRMIMRVVNQKKPVIGVMSSLQVMGMPAMPYPMPGQSQQPTPAWTVFQGLTEDYDVRQVQSGIQEIDKDIDVLILVHPKDLPDETLYAIDQFVLRGGRLAAFVDPMCVAERETGGGERPPYSPPDSSSTLGKLTSAWGVTIEQGKIVADLEAQLQSNPALLAFRRANMNASDILTSKLQVMVLPLSGSITGESTKDVTVTPLLTSSETSASISSMMAQMGPQSMRQAFKAGHKRLNVAVRLQGKFKTAFPEGKPAAPGSDSADKEQKAKDAIAATAGLKESQGTSTVILVADADMLYDRFCFEELNFLGYAAKNPLNDNMSFFVNTIDQLAGGADLASIRSRSKSARPFDVVLKLESKAQAQWLEQEKVLQARVQETEQKLRQLEAEKDKGQRFILSAEQKKTIEQFRDDMAQTKKELKLVRRKLRADIERLGMWVKFANILLMPGIVIFAGIGFSLYRRSKMGR